MEKELTLFIEKVGAFLGIRGERLIQKQKDGEEIEIPLKHLKMIICENKNISISSELLTQCALRGIHFFIINYKNEIVTSLYGSIYHAIYKLREKQFNFINSEKSIELSKELILAKIKNQRSLILYFFKYYSKRLQPNIVEKIKYNIGLIDQILNKFLQTNITNKNSILGFEGEVAKIYWATLKLLNILPKSFEYREKRGTEEITNKMLNYSYAILSSYIWRSLQLAGLEIYAGFLHTERSGKPSLVIDIMEIYRAWVSDRSVLKHALSFKDEKDLTTECKKKIIEDITSFMNKKIKIRNKKLKLSTIIQRDAYRLAGHFYGKKKFKPYIFRW